MRYKSNLEAPDLRPYFKLHIVEGPCGHDRLSDPDFDPECSFWTDDEAAILYNVVRQVPGKWIDIGCRVGWTTAHMLRAGARVFAVDPILQDEAALKRFRANTDGYGTLWPVPCLASDFFHTSRITPGAFVGTVIDGDHGEHAPALDALNSAAVLGDEWGGVILLHDFQGKPVRDAVLALLDIGFRARIYWTPNGVACCWKALPDFKPPDHVRDPNVWWRPHEEGMRDFPFERCE